MICSAEQIILPLDIDTLSKYIRRTYTKCYIFIFMRCVDKTESCAHPLPRQYENHRTQRPVNDFHTVVSARTPTKHPGRVSSRSRTGSRLVRCQPAAGGPSSAHGRRRHEFCSPRAAPPQRGATLTRPRGAGRRARRCTYNVCAFKCVGPAAPPHVSAKRVFATTFRSINGMAFGGITCECVGDAAQFPALPVIQYAT